jgi:hypothetical protein
VTFPVIAPDGQSLTRPAVVKRFLHPFLTYKSLFFSFVRTPVRPRRNLLSLDRCFRLELCSPYSLGPCRFIASVLPTNHLFDHLWTTMNYSISLRFRIQGGG